jgi:Fis family transcriptional regulator, factor for inversion stimulation protein
MASGYNTAPRILASTRSRHRQVRQHAANQNKNTGTRFARAEQSLNQDEAAEDMSKESIQEVVQKSLEDYFNDLGEQKPTNIYDMMVLTVEKPVLEVVMSRADGNQSHAAQMLGINRNTLRKKLQEHGLL